MSLRSLPKPTPGMPLAGVEQLANELVPLLWPACERLVVAGSIRRRERIAGDIELVALPVRVRGHDPETTDLLHELLIEWRKRGLVEDRLDRNGRASFGVKAKRLLYRGAPLDIYAVREPCWGVQLALRTGPAEYSRSLVTPRRIGGLLPDEMLVRDGWLWRSEDRRALPIDKAGRARIKTSDLVSIPCFEEADFFRALKLPHIAPEQRA